MVLTVQTRALIEGRSIVDGAMLVGEAWCGEVVRRDEAGRCYRWSIFRI